MYYCNFCDDFFESRNIERVHDSECGDYCVCGVCGNPDIEDGYLCRVCGEYFTADNGDAAIGICEDCAQKAVDKLSAKIHELRDELEEAEINYLLEKLADGLDIGASLELRSVNCND